jgi:predicted hotdog family 3-hydroxylacyl-ACP dehydratase
MLMLARVLAHTPEETVCALAQGGGTLFRDADGYVPAYLALEAMAQAAAVHAGLATRAGRRAPGAALLLGSRRLQLSAQRLAPGRALRVHARHQRGEAGLVVFECALRDETGGVSLAEGRVSLYTVNGMASGDRQHDG